MTSLPRSVLRPWVWSVVALGGLSGDALFAQTPQTITPPPQFNPVNVGGVQYGAGYGNGVQYGAGYGYNNGVQYGAGGYNPNVQYGAGNFNPYNNPYNNPFYGLPNPANYPAGTVILPNGQVILPTTPKENDGNGGNNNGGNGNNKPTVPGQYPNGGYYRTPDGSVVVIPQNGTVTTQPWDGKGEHLGVTHRSGPRSHSRFNVTRSGQEPHQYKNLNKKPIGTPPGR